MNSQIFVYGCTVVSVMVALCFNNQWELPSDMLSANSMCVAFDFDLQGVGQGWGETEHSHRERLTARWPGDPSTQPLREAILFIGRSVRDSSSVLQLPHPILSRTMLGQLKSKCPRNVSDVFSNY